MNRSIKDAVVAEENFFHNRPIRKFLCIVNSLVFFCLYLLIFFIYLCYS